MTMKTIPIFKNRSLDVSYWDIDRRSVDSAKSRLEAGLRMVADYEITEITDLKSLSPQADLLVISATLLPQEGLIAWFRKLIVEMQSTEKVWVPAVILCQLTEEDLLEVMHDAIQSNWYVDLLDPSHLSSLPIRVASLIRIHDHLKELLRYDDKLADLQAQIDALSV